MAVRRSITAAFSQTLHRRTLTAPRSFIQATRPLSTTTRLSATENPNPQKAAQQDRKKMDTQPNEYAKSGTDSAAAGQEEAAFNKDTPKPEDAKQKAGEGNDVNPLDASPANQDISQTTSEQESGAGKKMSEDGGGRQGGGDSTGDKYGGSSV